MRAPPIEAWLGTGLVAVYHRDREGTLQHEGPRPGAGWHRHDWQRRTLIRVTSTGILMEVVARRRWRQGRRGPTQLDRAPDELLDLRSTVLVVFLKVWAWLASGVGLHVYDERVAAIARHGCRRTVQRWVRRIHPCGPRLQQALRTAVIERLEPQPFEKLFPGGLSPPGAIRRRRWKDPALVYSLATALAFLVDGATALRIPLPALLAEALRRLDGLILAPAP